MTTVPNEHAYADSPLDLSVIVPAYNESEALAGVIASLRSALGGWGGRWEVIVIDDGSTDDTAAIAAVAGVRLIRHPVNLGYGASIKRGIRAASGRLVCTIDGDGSYVATDILDLLRHCEGYDQVNGVRKMESGTLPYLRASAKWCIRKLCEWVSGKRIPDLNTGLKLFDRGSALDFAWLLPDGFSCSTSLTLAFLCNGQAVKFVPVGYRRRLGCSKFRPIRDSANYLMTGIRVIMYFKPLRVFLPIAAGLSVGAVLKIAFDSATRTTGINDSDIILFVSAVIVAALGLLADLMVSVAKATANASARVADRHEPAASRDPNPIVSAVNRSDPGP